MGTEKTGYRWFTVKAVLDTDVVGGEDGYDTTLRRQLAELRERDCMPCGGLGSRRAAQDGDVRRSRGLVSLRLPLRELGDSSESLCFAPQPHNAVPRGAAPTPQPAVPQDHVDGQQAGSPEDHR